MTSEPSIEVRSSARRHKTVSVHREGDTYVVVVPARLTRAQVAEATRSVVEKLQAKERRSLAPGGDAELQAMAVELASTYLRDHPVVTQRVAVVRWSKAVARWGSCSTLTGDIAISDRLRTAPRWVVEHVLLHELSHLVHHDHGPRFHALADRHPRAERAEGYLAGLAHGLGCPDGTDSGRAQPPQASSSSSLASSASRSSPTPGSVPST